MLIPREIITYKQEVAGSSPALPTKPSYSRRATVKFSGVGGVTFDIDDSAFCILRPRTKGVP